MLAQIAGAGFRPDLIIDVGAGRGTWQVYAPFPDARILLIEALEEFAPELRRVCQLRPGRYILAAAGSVAGSITIHVHDRDLYGSSSFHEVEGASVDGTERQVTCIPLDDVVEPDVGRILMKLDVQGAELDVLDGATRTLERTEIVIMEAVLYDMLVGAPRVADKMSYMTERGFVLYDLCDLLYRPLDGALSQVDLVFVREGGRFRQNHAFAAPGQRDALQHDKYGLV